MDYHRPYLPGTRFAKPREIYLIKTEPTITTASDDSDSNQRTLVDDDWWHMMVDRRYHDTASVLERLRVNEWSVWFEWLRLRITIGNSTVHRQTLILCNQDSFYWLSFVNVRSGKSICYALAYYTSIVSFRCMQIECAKTKTRNKSKSTAAEPSQGN